MATIEEVDPTFCSRFSEWLERGTTRNIWIYGDVVSVYMRRSVRSIGARGYQDTYCSWVLDIGSIEVDIRKRCGGVGTMVLDHIHANHPFAATYIENILTKRFLRHLNRRGWRTVDVHDYSPSVFKVTGKESLYD